MAQKHHKEEVSRNRAPTAQTAENNRSMISLRYLLVVICALVAAAAVGYQVLKEQTQSQSKAGQERQEKLKWQAQQEDNKELEEQEDAEELRILLVGKTGVGKSATGNTILREKAFKSDLSSTSVTTECKKADGYVKGRKVVVIDSPGLFDTQLTADEVADRIKMCIPLSAPGLHVFVVVIQIGRFTEEEENTLKIFQNMFGRECYNYTMALFTHGDKLKGKNIHHFIRNNTNLLDFIKKCRGSYHVFNNEDKNPKQVVQLLEQIDKMVTRNGGEYYTTEMLQEAERVIEEEKQRILKENEAQRMKEMEELRAKYKGEALEEAKKQLQEEHERQARAQAERNPSFFDIIGYIVSAPVRFVLSLLNL